MTLPSMNGHKRAAIYVRVSREIQAEKVSPEVQETDCRAYCEQRGYEVVAVYRDTEKYRVGKRMIEPSGTRADRPALKQMLSDARACKFEVIVGWREDRIYRGSRPMLDVLDCIEEAKIDIELVKENFDKRIAPVKAWAAKMELDARKDRTAMGIMARFAKGKVWTKGVPYGYRKGKDDFAEVDPEEGKWVTAIWKWKAEGKTIREIRTLLLERGAPQRRQQLCKFPWQYAKVQHILRNPTYYTGVQIVSWEGNTFEIPYPVLVDAETANRVKTLIARARAHPARHLKHNYLGMGLGCCAACNLKLSVSTRPYRKNKNDPRKKPIGVYVCQNVTKQNRIENCVRQIGGKKFDTELWRKVSMVLTNHEDFEQVIQIRINDLKKDEGEVQTQIERIRGQLASLEEERQWVVTQARKKTITEKDMEQQLAMLTAQENELKHELADKSLVVGNRAERLMDFMSRYRANIRGKLEWLNSEPQTPEEEEQQFKARRHIIEDIVRRIDVHGDKSLNVTFEFDLTEMEQIKDRQR